MTERDAIHRSEAPVTTARLVEDLRALGVSAGDTVLVHSSLSALGWVCGGAPAAVDALTEAVTADGTLVVPTHTSHYSDPSFWENPPVPDDWEGTIRDTIPPYRPAVTPSRGMGAIAECFRQYPDAVRSDHPTVSFAAWGADADAVVADHDYDFGLGEGSPLARLFDREASVLLLGVGHDSNTSLHLADNRADYDQTVVTTGAPVADDGQRRWAWFTELEGDTDDFEAVGAAFEDDRPDAVERDPVGETEAALLDQRALVEYASEWFGEHR